MSNKATVTLTVGVSGSGKTYYRCAVFLVDDWLPFHDGKLISNYPINMENLLADFPEASERIELIPEEVLNEWRRGSSGPWDYFSGRDISGCHIAIDEVHNYCGSASDIKVRRRWQAFVGELRHRGATIEFLTQAEAKCSKELLAEAEIRYEIQNGENRRMPVLGYRMGDLYELRAKLIKKYLCPSYCIEKTNADGAWHVIDEKMFYRLPSYFKYYNSFSAPMSGGESGNKSEKRPWEKYSWPKLLIWFLFQYPFRIPFQVGIVALFCWFFFGGGMLSIMTNMFEGFRKASGHVVRKVGVGEVTKNPDIQKLNDTAGTAEVPPVTSGRRYVRANPLEYCSPSGFRWRGVEYKVGDPYYGGSITDVTRYGFVVDGYIYVPYEWLDDML